MKRKVSIVTYLFVTAVSLCAVLVSCDSSQDDNVPAFAIVRQSRVHLAAGEYDAARDSVLVMRKKFPAAVMARYAGLLLLDSIELAAAQDSLDAAPAHDRERLELKCRFFRRKLQEDLKKDIGRK